MTVETDQTEDLDPETEVEAAYAIAVGMLLLFPQGVLRGWVLSRLWAWFLVPIGVPRISWAIGAGIVMMVRLLVAGRRATKSDLDDITVDKTLADVTDGVAFTLGVFGVAAVFALFL